VSAVALVVALTADYAVFRLFDANYFRWYLANGPLIQLLVTGFAVAVDLEREPRLISTHPGEYLASCFAVGGESFLALAADMEPKKGERSGRKGGFEPFAEDADTEVATRRREQRLLPRAGPLDSLFAGLFDIAFFILCIAWLAVVAPIQYFGNLVAGAPARLALANPRRMWVSHQPGRTELVTAPVEEAPEGSEEVGLARRPVALTASITAGLLLAISYVV
jgi:hypothetical protein